ncbi:MAG: cyanophycin synthetase, partial [Nitrospinota bacterium]
EIRATLRAIREAWPERRLVVVFQPHRYTRTHYLAKAFHTAFYDADILFVAPIYAAGEAPIPGVSASALAEGVRAHGHKACGEVKDIQEAAGKLAE